MSTFHCTRCDGTGFLNIEQVSDHVLREFQATGNHELILSWIVRRNLQRGDQGCYCAATRAPCGWCENAHDVAICDCCGNGETWHGVPGEHDWDNPEDTKGCR